MGLLKGSDLKGSDEHPSGEPGRPRRYKLYDRIAAKVSVNTMNVIIVVTSALLLAAIIVGVVTRNPQ